MSPQHDTAPHDANAIPTAQAIEFVRLITGGRGRIAVARIDPAGGAPVGRTFELPSDTQALTDWIAACDGAANVYFSLNEPVPAEQQHGANGKLKERDVLAIRGIAVDLDPVAAVEREPGGFERERKRLLAKAHEWKDQFVADPSAIVDSGNGVQFIWLFDAPLPNDPDTAAAVKSQAKALARLFGAGADSVQSLDHLFRMPETANLPDERKRAKGRKPTRAHVLSLSPARYSLATLAMLVPPSQSVAADTEALEIDDFDYDAALDAACTPSSLPIDLAEIASSIRTENRRLLDMSDRSARDFALAMRCIERGMTDATKVAQVVFSLSPEKLIEKEEAGRGEQYARRTVERALTRDRKKVDGLLSPLVPVPGELVSEASADVTRGRFAAPLIVSFPILRRAIPQRQWLVFPAIPKGEAVLLVGPPKASKSAWAISLSVAVATGDATALFEKGRDAPWRFKPGRVLIVNNEDSTDEIRRRIAAVVERTGCVPATGSIAVLSGADPEALRLSVRRAVRGSPSVRTEGYDFLAEEVRRFAPDLVIFDSLVSMGEGLSENDNAEMDQLVRDLRRIAAQSGATALLVHHTSKGKADAAGDAGAARGAGAIYGAIRAGFTLIPLTPEQSRRMGLSQGRYIRMDDSGGNYSAKDDRVHVWRIDQFPVGNGIVLEGETHPAAWFDEASRGDTAPVLSYVGALRNDGKKIAAVDAVEGSETAARAPAIARIVYEAVASTGGEQSALDARMKDEIGRRLKAAGFVRGKTHAAIDKALRGSIGADGVAIEFEGRSVRVYRRSLTGRSRSQMFVGYEIVAPAAEAQSSEICGKLRNVA
jgi:hypothetical protein